MIARIRTAALVVPLLLLAAGSSPAQQTPPAAGVTTPEQFFGHRIGADHVLPNYEQLVSYWRVLEEESARMVLVPIGETAEGRTQLMAVVTSPANHAGLERYREIARTLALARGVTEEQARALAEEGRAVVWIDGGLHATEVLGAQQLMETVYQLVSRNDAETRRILDDVIVLAVHANPDGHDLVSDWYMRRDDPLARSPDFDIPRLYQKYIGHDNNRDFYMSSQPETTNMNRVLYREWFPQVVYNHHQTGPVGQVMWAPPFREPYNHRIHPLVRLGIETVAASMHTRFITENRPGVGRGEAAGYSVWWNGGLRTTTYFHNMIGILTETKGNPTPSGARAEIPLVPHLQLSTDVMPYPIEPGPVSFRDVVDYSVTANYAVLDVASRQRQLLLYNIYRMGRDAIERGSRDSWTHQPSGVAALTDAMLEAQARSYDADGRWVDSPGMAEACMRVRTGMPVSLQRPCLAGAEARRRFEATLRDPALREPRGYVLPADQPDFATATKFVHALQKNGVTVQRATAPFTIAGTRYPAASYIVSTAQAFGPHVLDMFEPQDHPHDVEYPGGPPVHPYDAAGYTLAYQMGVRFDRILDAFDGPFEDVEPLAPVVPGTIAGAGDDGWFVSAHQNDAFRLVSNVLADGGRVFRSRETLQVDDETLPAGSFYIPRPQDRGEAAAVEALVTQLGLVARRTAGRPVGALAEIERPRIGLWDEYGGSMPSGWTRWLLEQFDVPFRVVYAPELDAGQLRDRYDVLVFVDGAIPARDGAAPVYPDDVPDEFRHMLGHVTVERTVPQLREFVERGGRIVTIGSSTVLARHLGVPVSDHLVTSDEERGTRPLRGSEFFIPASVLRVRTDPSQPLAYGLDEWVDVMFDRSPVMRPADGANAGALERVAWYDSDAPLRSGWAWGQQHLRGGLAAADARVGAGRLFLFGPEILYRAQPHGTFKLFFNSLYYAEPVADRADAAPATPIVAHARRPLPLQRGDTIRFVVRSGGRVGERLVWQDDAGGYVQRLSYAGRELESRIVSGGDGVPERVEITGTHPMGYPVHEQFETPGISDGFYTSLEYEAAFQLPLLTGALLASPDGTLQLRPDGIARIEEIGRLPVEANGQARVLTHYAIHGLDLAPEYVWLDEHGTFTADAVSIREGWEGAHDQLAAASHEALIAHSQRLLGPLIPPARTAPLVIRNARLFDAAGPAVRDGATVVVVGDRIAEVGPAGTVAEPADAEVIDAAGRMLLPGLWDMHVHIHPGFIEELDAPLFLAAGVTTVRDLGSETDLLLSLRERTAAHRTIGPRILAGLIMYGPGSWGTLGATVSTPEEARAAVDRFAAQGYVQVKLYNPVPPELATVIIERARHHGLRVSGHLPNGMTGRDVVEHGFDEIQHLLYARIAVVGFDRPVDMAPRLAALDTADAGWQAFVRLLVERNVAIDPTLAVVEETVGGRPATWLAAVLDRFPARAGRMAAHHTGPLAPPFPPEHWDPMTANGPALLRSLHAAGVPLVIGTDAQIGGFELQRELELWVEAGIPAAEVLALATLGAATIMGMDDELGSIEPGKVADMILVDGDPTTDITDIRRVVTVVKDGRVHDPAGIYRALGFRP